MYSPLRQLLWVSASILILCSLVCLKRNAETGGGPDSVADGTPDASGSWFDFLRVPALLSHMEEDRQREAELIAESKTAVRRVVGKDQAIKDLSLGRLTLLEAARRFRDLNAASLNFDWDRFRKTYPGGSDEERHCREVICRLQGLTAYLTGQPEDLAEQLEAELQQLLTCDTLHFPPAEEPKDR